METSPLPQKSNVISNSSLVEGYNYW